MTTLRERAEFASYVMRVHNIQTIMFQRRDLIVLKSAGKTIASASVQRSSHGRRLVLNAASNSWAALLRFHISRQNNCSVRMYDPHANTENSCRQKRCFQYLCEAFPNEWIRFQGGNVAENQNVPDDGASSAHKVTKVPTTIGPIIVNKNGGGSETGMNVSKCVGEECVLEHIKRFAEELDNLVDGEKKKEQKVTNKKKP